jgi:hypothetical protein
LQVREIMRSLVSLAILFTPAVAAAHIQLTNPLPRTLELKQPNCGLTGSTRSANPAVYPPGATITVTWKETINHPGHYRVSFDQDGEDFTIPLSFTDTTQTENVLVDNIADAAIANDTYNLEITLPNLECENCTLQVIQMMTDKPPYGDGNDIYFQCADVALRADAPLPPDAGPDDNPANPDAGIDDDPPDSFGDATGGCNAGRRDSAGMAGLLLAVLITARRRR